MFKIGDKVIVRDDVDNLNYSYTQDFLGQQVKVTSVDDSQRILMIGFNRECCEKAEHDASRFDLAN